MHCYRSVNTRLYFPSCSYIPATGTGCSRTCEGVKGHNLAHTHASLPQLPHLVVVRSRVAWVLLTRTVGGVVASLDSVLGRGASSSRTVKSRQAAARGGRVARTGAVEAGRAVGAVGRIGRAGKIVVGSGRTGLRVRGPDRAVASSCQTGVRSTGGWVCMYRTQVCVYFLFINFKNKKMIRSGVKKMVLEEKHFLRG